jgi:hypothetical protein
MTRISILTVAMMTVASTALAQSNPNPGLAPNPGVGISGPTYSAPGQQGGTLPSVGAGTGAGPTFTTPARPRNSTAEPDSTSEPNSRRTQNSAPVPPNSNSGHPPDQTEGSGAAPSR